MWRQNAFPGNFDSEQNISDEEDFNGDFGGSCFTSTRNTAGEEGMLVQSRLEMLQGTYEPSSEKKTSSEIMEKGNSCFADDEVEVPEFADEADFNFLPRDASLHRMVEEEKSGKEGFQENDNGGGGTGRQDRGCRSSMVCNDSEALDHLYTNAVSSCSAYSKANKSCKGSRNKVKPKFSFYVQSQTDKISQTSISKDESFPSPKLHDFTERPEILEDGIVENSSPELQQDVGGRNENQLETMLAKGEALGKGFVEHSMSELLDGLQDKNFLLRGNSKPSRRGKDRQLVMKRSIAGLGHRIIDSGEQPEPVASGSSSDDECNDQNLMPAGAEMKRQTMADRFQEALAANSLNNEAAFPSAAKPSSIGLFTKLQQVMQSEKERDTLFLHKLHAGTRPNGDQQSITVKILSKYLDAKLTVCRCYIGQNTEGFYWPESYQTPVDRGRTRTVIFSARVCVDVDLEVGNLIHIHRPWKEIRVTGGDEIIILSTYFSNSLR